SLVDDLRKTKSGVAIATIDFSPERAGVVRMLNSRGVPVTAWLVLPESEGYFFDAENVSAARQRFTQFRLWSKSNDLRWVAVGLDIEPDIHELAKLSRGNGWNLIPVFAARLFDYGSVRQARADYTALINEIRVSGWSTQTYQFPFIADER